MKYLKPFKYSVKKLLVIIKAEETEKKGKATLSCPICFKMSTDDFISGGSNFLTQVSGVNLLNFFCTVYHSRIFGRVRLSLH